MWQLHLSIFCYKAPVLVVILITFYTYFMAASTSQKVTCPIQSIYQLGDSISDTGNLVQIIPPVSASRFPYGETFPGYPTGRWSDGRLVIDYIAQSLGLPLLNPYLAKNASFQNGVNFAVASSTTLDPLFYAANGIFVPPVPSLLVQLRWFKTYLTSICSNLTDCRDKLGRSLIFVGEIGYNDIRYPFIQERSIQRIQSYLEIGHQVIINTTRDVIHAGANQVIVPGVFPLGCFPFALSSASIDDTATYDDVGCLQDLNNLIAARNKNLQGGLNMLRREFPNVTILYADLYNSFLSLVRDAPSLGFDNKTLLKACCGVDGHFYTLDPEFCGNGKSQVCPDPNKYIHWDGIHLTQEAHRYLANILIGDLGFKCAK